MNVERGLRILGGAWLLSVLAAIVFRSETAWFIARLMMGAFLVPYLGLIFAALAYGLWSAVTRPRNSNSDSTPRDP